MGPGQSFLTSVGSFILLGLGRVGSATSRSGKFPIKIQYFSLRVKKIPPDQVKKYPGQRQVSPLFNIQCGSEIYFGQVGSGAIFNANDAKAKTSKQLSSSFIELFHIYVKSISL